MNTDENNQEVVVDTTNNEGEGESKVEENIVKVSKEEYDKLNQTLGSLKRELKEYKKSQDVKETSKTNQPEDNNILLEKLEKMSLRQAGITEQEDMDLARNTAKKWNMDLDEVLADPDFKLKLERQQTIRANTLATSNVRGGASNSQAKNTPEYWQAKGVPPTPNDVPDRKTRQSIVRAMLSSSQKSGSGFYNE